MNERIRELAHEAGLPTYNPDGIPTRLEQFAELLIRECADVCYQHSERAGGTFTAFGYGYKDCGDDIKQTFGVK